MPKIIKEINKSSPELGNSIADFEILSELGRGSYGVVLKVRSRKNGQMYALKKLPMKHMKPKHQKEALQEVLLLKRLSHPNIIHYYISFVENDCLYILMELAVEGDLDKLIKKAKKRKKLFPEKEIWRFAYEIASGLKYLHENNIIHRDIKCLNILLSNQMTVKVW